MHKAIKEEALRNSPPRSMPATTTFAGILNVSQYPQSLVSRGFATLARSAVLRDGALKPA